MRKDYPIVGSYDNQRISTINAERSVNLFEFIDPNGKRPNVLIPTAGLINADLNFGAETGGSRASFVFNDTIFQVFGKSVYTIKNSNGTLIVNQIGNFTTTIGYVGIDANTFQVIFVDGALGYIYDINAQTFVQITDTGFPKSPVDVCYLDGFFVVANGGTNQFQLSSFNQGMVWSGGLALPPAIPVSFTASTVTNQLTLSGNSFNFQTGVPITLTTTSGAVTFTADIATDILTLSASNANFPSGTSLKFSTTGSLPTTTPTALNTTDIFYAVQVATPATNPGTIKIATTLAAALAGTPTLDITVAGTGVNTVNGASILPAPLIAGTTYYVILVGAVGDNPGHIQLATTYANAIAGIPIVLTSQGAPVNNIAVTGQLQLGQITSHPGNIVACNTLHRRLFLFSANFTEIWENAGAGTNLPFRRNNSLLMEVGTPAVGSISVGFDKLFFLAQDKDGLAGVMVTSGTEARLLSNRALDFQLAQYAADPVTGVADARGVLIKENGLIFYRLNFTLANHTFVNGVTMSAEGEPKWHEEEVLNGDRHPAQTHAYFDGVNYYGDYKSPKLYIVSDSTSSNDNEHIRRMRIGRQMTPEGYNRLRIDRFVLDLLQGQESEEGDDVLGEIDLLTELSEPITTENDINIILEQGIDIDASSGDSPIVYLSISKDGGQTFGYLQLAAMGKVGERTFRTVWRKLGTTPRGQGFVPKIEFFNTIPFYILGAAWDFEDMPE
jgi:hypothetical protein